LNWWNNISIIMLIKKRISSEMINRLETCANADATSAVAMAAVNENMKKATCAGDLSILRPKSLTIRPKPTLERFIPKASVKTAIITASNGRKETMNCSINPAFNKYFPINIKS